MPVDRPMAPASSASATSVAHRRDLGRRRPRRSSDVHRRTRSVEWPTSARDVDRGGRALAAARSRRRSCRSAAFALASSRSSGDGSGVSARSGARLMPQLPATTVVTPWVTLSVMSGCDSSAWSSWVCESMKPGATMRPRGVERRVGAAAGEVADGGDAAADDADVGVEARRARAVDRRCRRGSAGRIRAAKRAWGRLRNDERRPRRTAQRRIAQRAGAETSGAGCCIRCAQPRVASRGARSSHCRLRAALRFVNNKEDVDVPSSVLAAASLAAVVVLGGCASECADAAAEPVPAPRRKARDRGGGRRFHRQRRCRRAHQPALRERRHSASQGQARRADLRRHRRALHATPAPT